MRLGFIILAHEDLDRVAEMTDYLVDHNCAVVIHVDQRADRADYAALVAQFSQNDHVKFSRRLRCEWGRFSLVQAALNSAELLLENFGRVQNVMLISGACLPVRPVSQLKSYLERRQGIEFIESVSVEQEKWVQGGLYEERFTLFFPVAFRRARWLFNRLVAIQRAMGMSRRIPEQIEPHIGSQWWCLTRETLSAILTDRNRPKYDRYFRNCWIPDEAYFQTLVRLHSKFVESRSLTFAKFDASGKPFLLYDDHLDMLQQSDCFFARKVWRHANYMRKTLLQKGRSGIALSATAQRTLDGFFDTKIEERRTGAQGKYTIGRFPTGQRSGHATCRPYVVMVGMGEVFKRLPQYLSQQTESMVHGHIFDRRNVAFVDNAPVMRGNLIANIKTRNRNPRAFLSNLIWNHAETAQGFLFDASDHHRIRPVLYGDPNARIFVLRGSWMLKLLHQKKGGRALVTAAKRYQQLENILLGELADPSNECKVEIVDLADLLERPTATVKQIRMALRKDSYAGVIEMPMMRDLSGLDALARKLRNEGFNIPELPKPDSKPDIFGELTDASAIVPKPEMPGAS